MDHFFGLSFFLLPADDDSDLADGYERGMFVTGSIPVLSRDPFSFSFSPSPLFFFFFFFFFF